jgi:hypothetical protein
VQCDYYSGCETGDRGKIRGRGSGLNISLNDYLDKVAEIVPPVSIDQEGQLPPRNEAMIAALRQSAERLKDVPVSGSTAETLEMIQKARAGDMWGYEPTTE